MTCTSRHGPVFQIERPDAAVRLGVTQAGIFDCQYFSRADRLAQRRQDVVRRRFGFDQHRDPFQRVARAAILREHSVDLVAQTLCRLGQFRIGSAHHSRNAQMKGLQLGRRERQRRQKDRQAQDVSDPALTLDRNA